jgi:putative ABC transport system substrate-binding protein
VFNSGVDPIKLGLVESLNRPGANLTGTYILVGALAAKRLGLLRDLIMTDAVIGVLLNPKNASAAEQLDDVEKSAAAIGRQVLILRATNAAEIDEAFAAMATARTGAALIGADPFFLNRRQQIVALAARHAMPAIYEFREFADAGGLISYGPSLPEAYRQVGIYAGRILNGERPADLPVMQPTRFELVINLETAKALGLAVPLSLLARADEVIE